MRRTNRPLFSLLYVCIFPIPTPGSAKVSWLNTAQPTLAVDGCDWLNCGTLLLRAMRVAAQLGGSGRTSAPRAGLE